jgi:hypothetical protein
MINRSQQRKRRSDFSLSMNRHRKKPPLLLTCVAETGVWKFSQAKRFGTEGNDGNKGRKNLGKILAETRPFPVCGTGSKDQEWNRREQRKQRVGLSCRSTPISAFLIPPPFPLFAHVSLSVRAAPTLHGPGFAGLASGRPKNVQTPVAGRGLSALPQHRPTV